MIIVRFCQIGDIQRLNKLKIAKITNERRNKIRNLNKLDDITTTVPSTVNCYNSDLLYRRKSNATVKINPLCSSFLANEFFAVEFLIALIIQ